MDAELRDLIDRQAILDCLTRFCRGMDRFDRDLALSAFHGDAVCDYGPLLGTPAELWDWNERMGEATKATAHQLGNHSCEIARDEAHSETYLLYSARYPDDSIWQAHGRYIDRLERRDGHWGIVMRYCVIEMSGVVAQCDEPFAGIAGLHANGAPSRGRNDPSYRRPLANRRNPRRLSD